MQGYTFRWTVNDDGRTTYEVSAPSDENEMLGTIINHFTRSFDRYGVEVITDIFRRRMDTNLNRVSYLWSGQVSNVETARTILGEYERVMG